MPIQARHIRLGRHVVIENSAVIRGIDGDADEIIIGDNTYIGESVQIICNRFEIGDYGKIHHHTNIHGYSPCRIGHNAWIGQHSVLDSIGGIEIGNNCGIGAYSQLWSHIKYGDTLEGCRFYAEKPLIIGNDVWLVGHCIVSPVSIADKAMALAGSVITHDMDYNTVYAGCPAVAISSKIGGGQFVPVSIETKLTAMRRYVEESGIDADAVRIVATTEEFCADGRSYFAVATRQYLKTQSLDEIKLMHYLLPYRAKFVPLRLYHAPRL